MCPTLESRTHKAAGSQKMLFQERFPAVGWVLFLLTIGATTSDLEVVNMAAPQNGRTFVYTGEVQFDRRRSVLLAFDLAGLTNDYDQVRRLLDLIEENIKKLQNHGGQQLQGKLKEFQAVSNRLLEAKNDLAQLPIEVPFPARPKDQAFNWQESIGISTLTRDTFVARGTSLVVDATRTDRGALQKLVIDLRKEIDHWQKANLSKSDKRAEYVTEVTLLTNQAVDIIKNSVPYIYTIFLQQTVGSSTLLSVNLAKDIEELLGNSGQPSPVNLRLVDFYLAKGFATLILTVNQANNVPSSFRLYWPIDVPILYQGRHFKVEARDSGARVLQHFLAVSSSFDRFAFPDANLIKEAPISNNSFHLAPISTFSKEAPICEIAQFLQNTQGSGPHHCRTVQDEVNKKTSVVSFSPSGIHFFVAPKLTQLSFICPSYKFARKLINVQNFGFVRTPACCQLQNSTKIKKLLFKIRLPLRSDGSPWLRTYSSSRSMLELFNEDDVPTINFTKQPDILTKSLLIFGFSGALIWLVSFFGPVVRRVIRNNPRSRGGTENQTESASPMDLLSIM